MFNDKTILEKNIIESLFIIDNIEKNNSLIHEERVLDTLNKFPFLIEDDNGLTLSSKYRDKATSSDVLDGYNVIVSIIAIEDTRTGKVYHLLSKNAISNNYYINLQLLESLKQFNEFYVEKLALMKTDNIEQILELLFNGFKSAYNLMGYKLQDFKTRGIKEKIYYIKSYIKSLKEAKKSDVIPKESYYMFYSSDFNMFKNIKSDLIELKEHVKSPGIKFFIDYVKNNKIDNIPTPFSIKIEHSKNSLFSKKYRLTHSQSDAINNANSAFYSIIGLAGSGKTRNASVFMKNYLKLHAVLLAVKNKSIPFMYASYTVLSNKTFIENMSDFRDIILYTDNVSSDSDFSQSINNKIENTIMRTDDNIDKLKEIQSKLRGYQYLVEHLEQYEEYLKPCATMNEQLSDKERKDVVKLGNLIKSRIQKNAKRGFFQKLFIKNDPLSIPNKMKDKLSKFINIGNIIEDYELKKVYSQLRKIYQKKEPEIQYSKLKTLSFNINISDEDILFYVTHYYLLDEEEEKKRDAVLRYIASFKDKPDGDKNILSSFIREYSSEEFIETQKKLYPVTVSAITDLRKFIPINYNFILSIVDESLMVPSYFTYSLLSRTSNIIMMGDVSQMNFSHFFPITNMRETVVRKIYNGEENFVKYNLWMSNNYDINSFFDAIKNNKDIYSTSKNGILVDNFRSVSGIVKAQVKLSKHYFRYVKDYFLETGKYSADSLKNSDDVAEFIHTFRTDNKNYIFENGTSTDSPLLLYNVKDFLNREYLYSNLFKFIDNQSAIKNKNILIVTPLKIHIKPIKEIVDRISKHYPNIRSVFVGHTMDIQGLEYDIVIFDSNIQNHESEMLQYLMQKIKILSVSISRAKDLFIFMGNEQALKTVQKGTPLYELFSTDIFQNMN